MALVLSAFASAVPWFANLYRYDRGESDGYGVIVVVIVFLVLAPLSLLVQHVSPLFLVPQWAIGLLTASAVVRARRRPHDLGSETPPEP